MRILGRRQLVATAGHSAKFGEEGVAGDLAIAREVIGVGKCSRKQKNHPNQTRNTMKMH